MSLCWWHLLNCLTKYSICSESRPLFLNLRGIEKYALKTCINMPTIQTIQKSMQLSKAICHHLSVRSISYFTVWIVESSARLSSRKPWLCSELEDNLKKERNNEHFNTNVSKGTVQHFSERTIKKVWIQGDFLPLRWLVKIVPINPTLLNSQVCTKHLYGT